MMLRTPVCADRRAFHPDRTLLVVWLARDGIERALRHFVHVGFKKMKWHEDLPGSDNFGQSQLDCANAATLRDYVARTPEGDEPLAAPVLGGTMISVGPL